MNSCRLISPERVNELLGNLPPRKFPLSNDEHRLHALALLDLLAECGVYGSDVYSIGQNLSKLALHDPRDGRP
jgi:hypothetical protein